MPKLGIACPANVLVAGAVVAVLALSEPFEMVVPVVAVLGGVMTVGEMVGGITASGSDLLSLLKLSVLAFGVVKLLPVPAIAPALAVFVPVAPVAEVELLAVGVEFLSALAAEALVAPLESGVLARTSAPEAAAEAAEAASSAATGRAVPPAALALIGVRLPSDWPSLFSAPLPPPQALAMALTTKKLPTRRV